MLKYNHIIHSEFIPPFSEHIFPLPYLLHLLGITGVSQPAQKTAVNVFKHDNDDLHDG